jgi:hypothetical protein
LNHDFKVVLFPNFSMADQPVFRNTWVHPRITVDR